MTETWGMWENFLILRDHLCRGQSDPFGIVDWYRENHARLAPETDAANQPHTNQLRIPGYRLITQETP